MDFSDALRAMKAGKNVRRCAWKEGEFISNGNNDGVTWTELYAEDWLIVEDQKPSVPEYRDMDTQAQPPRKPKIGDVVLYHSSGMFEDSDFSEKCAAIVTGTRGDWCLDLTVFDGVGRTRGRFQVTQELPQKLHNRYPYWTWPDD